MIQPSFWKNKKVLVTGHTGFKGSWLTFWLSELGAQVSGISLPANTQPNAFDLLSLKNLCESHLVDIRDFERLKKTVGSLQPEIVFHMAAQPLVGLSYREPIETYATNVMGTGHLLMALADQPQTRALIVVTSDKCYENNETGQAYKESDPMGGHDPYSSSKACTEILTSSFRRSFFSTENSAGVATVRAGNVFGGGDWSPDRLIPDLVRTIHQNRSLEVRYPQAIRPWQHVLVPLSGYMALAQKLHQEPKAWSEAFNFAPTLADCVPVRDLIERFSKAWGSPISWSTPNSAPRHEAGFLRLDATKAADRLGWRPCWNLSEGLEATAEWYQAAAKQPETLPEVTRKQIRKYSEALLQRN